MDEELTKTLKYLRLSWLRANLDRVLDTAVKGNFSHLRLLKWIMEEEYRLKKEKFEKLETPPCKNSRTTVAGNVSL